MLRLFASFPSAIALFAFVFGATAAQAGLIVVYDNTVSANADGTQDFDGPVGFRPAEAYVEHNRQDATGTPYTWFASSLADGPVVEVGVDLTQPICCVLGSSEAVALSDITLSNDSDFAITPLLRLEIPAGEVILRDRRPLERETIAYFDVKLRDPGDGTEYFHYRLQVNATNGGFEKDASSTANVPIDETLNGGVEWGYKTAPYIDFILLPILEANDALQLQYVMQAYAENTIRYVEAEAGFSVKLGDPLTVGGTGGITLVPEPATSALLAAALALFVVLGAGQARAQACGSATDVPVEVLDDFVDTLGGLFPLGADECEKITKSAVAACHKAVSSSAACTAAQISGSRKGAKTGCKVKKSLADSCDAEFDALLDLAESALEGTVDYAQGECDGTFATTFDLICREGVE